MTDFMPLNFPFTAVAGQEALKLALVLTAISPRIGGVIISGPRGSAKSTLARGLGDVLPADNVAASFVTLPLGATEDRLLGSLDIESILNDKQVQFKPGLLARAHQGILYVDEVNLLPDMLVDQLLDVSASGVNRVERDGISHQHAAQFILIGTMNPEEGELRPQLQDRFGLMVELSNDYTLEERVQIVRLRDEYDQDSQGFCDAFKYKQRNLRQSIKLARERLPLVKCAEALRMDIASRCQDAQVDGVRADIVWVRAAVAHAAWRGAQTVSVDDVIAVEDFVLAHRRQRKQTPPNSPPPSTPPSSNRRPPDSKQGGKSPGKPLTSAEADPSAESDWGQMPLQTQSTRKTQSFTRPVIATSSTFARVGSELAGKRTGLVERGTTPNRSVLAEAIDWTRTIATNAGQWPPKQLQHKPAKTGQPVLHLVVLDTSASTLAEQAFGVTKGAILTIAQSAYQNREQIALLGFGGDQVMTLIAKVRAPQDISKQLDAIEAGGGTPIHHAVDEVVSYLESIKKRQPNTRAMTYILTDGRVSGAFEAHSLFGQGVVVDIEQTAVRRGRAQELAIALGCDYVQLSDCV